MKWIRMDVLAIKLGLTLRLRMRQLIKDHFYYLLHRSTFLGRFFHPTKKKLSEQRSISNTYFKFFPDIHDLEGNIK